MKFVLLYLISSLIIYIIISLIFKWQGLSKKVLIALGSAVLVLMVYYWLNYNNFTVTVKAVNNSKQLFDSIRVTTFPNRSFTFYNIKPGQSVTHSFEYRNFFYPRGEHGAAWALAYIDNYYFLCGTGLVDTPFALLEDEYIFYIWDNGISTRPDIKALGDRTEKHPLN